MSVSTTTLIAAMAAHRRRLVEHLKSVGAVDADSAIAVESLPRSGFRLVQQLKRRGVIREASEGRVYLDVQRFEQLQTSQRATARVIVMVLGGLAIVLAAVAYYMSAG